LATTLFASFGYSSTELLASAITRMKPSPAKRLGMIRLVVCVR